MTKRITFKIDCDIDLLFWHLVPSININLHSHEIEFEWLCIGVYIHKENNMKTIKFNPKETGWIPIDGDVKTIVAHFNNGEKKTMNIVDFVTMNRRKKNNIVQIDCYKEGEEIK